MDIEKQHIRIRAILEIIGKPKEFIVKKAQEYVERIKQDDHLMIISEKMSEPAENEKIFSVFCEIEVLIKGLDNFVGFCIDYMPSSIEVIKPEKFEYDQRVFTTFANDILSKLHNVDLLTKKIATENRVLKENMTGLVKNHILMMVRFGAGSMDKMTKAIGIEENELGKFISQLVEEKKIKKEGPNYIIA